MKDECLNCQLPICDDRDARCAFVQITRDPNKWYRDYYAENAEKEKARVKKWQQENKDRRNAYLRERYRLKNEQKICEHFHL